MKRLVSISVLFLLLSACAGMKPEEHADLECIAVTRDNLFVSFFPAKEAGQEIWTWNVEGSAVLDYSWVGEPGNIDKDGTFIPDRYAFGMGHRNNLSYRPEGKGSLEKLIKESGGRAYVYLNSPDQDERAKAGKKLLEILMPVLYRDGGVMIASRDPEAIKILLENRPTHAKLTVKTPYPSQNYECLAEILYIESD